MLFRPNQGRLHPVHPPFGGDLKLEEFAKIYFERRSNSEDQDPQGDAVRRSSAPQTDIEREIKATILTPLQRRAGDEDRLQDLFKTAQAPGRRRAHPADEGHQEGLDDCPHRHGQDRVGQGQARRPEPRGAEGAGRTDLPRRLRTGDGLEDGRRVMKPMRYQCRPAGKPAFYDTKYPARTTRVQTTSRASGRICSGSRIGGMVVERVRRKRDRDGTNTVLEDFGRGRSRNAGGVPGGRTGEVGAKSRISSPSPRSPGMSLATEVAAAGHDAVVPIKPENVDAWLQPDRKNLAPRLRSSRTAPGPTTSIVWLREGAADRRFSPAPSAQRRS